MSATEHVMTDAGEARLLAGIQDLRLTRAEAATLMAHDLLGAEDLQDAGLFTDPELALICQAARLAKMAIGKAA